MAVSELDPVFIKALKLLHSKNKDAADQLKELLDDVLVQRKKQKELDNEEKSDERSSKKYGSRKDLEKKEPEKRHLDQLSRDLAELSQDSAPVKRQKTEHTSFSGETVKKEERKRVREYKGSDSDDDVERVNETESKVSVVINDESDTGSDNEFDAASQRADDSIQKSPTDIDSFIIDQGLACVICKSFSVTSNNQLVECQECHSLYHQECHNPPPPKNINDPRFVWYCSQCTKTIKKSVPKPPVKAKLVSSSTKESSSSSSAKMPPSKSDSNLLNLQPFKRTEAVKMTSSISITTGSAMGLAGLAEKLHSKSASTSSEQSKQSRSSTDSQQQPAKTSSSSSKSSSSSSVDPTGIGALFKPDPVKVVASKASAPASQASTVKSQSILSGGSGSSKQAERTSSSSSTTAKPASSTSSQARGPGQSMTSATSTLTSSSKSQSLSSLSGSASAGGDKKTTTLTSTTADAADKRLQLMKKKAAVAAQSKKSLIK